MSVVFALATPPAKSAICVFRVSGSGCLDKLKTLTGSVPEKSRTFYLRPFLDKNGNLVDSVSVYIQTNYCMILKLNRCLFLRGLLYSGSNMLI